MKTKPMNIRVPVELYEKVKASGKPITYFVIKALEEMVEIKSPRSGTLKKQSTKKR